MGLNLLANEVNCVTAKQDLEALMKAIALISLLTTLLLLLVLWAVKEFHIDTRIFTADATLPDGSRYYGDLHDGLFHGEGKLMFANDGYYEGEFNRGLFSGQGVLKLASGDLYQGEFAAGMQDGQGKFVWTDGSLYEGQFKEGVLHGDGKLNFRGGDSYTGQFELNLMHGLGTYTQADGDIYNGEFIKDVFQGQGEHSDTFGNNAKGHFEDWRLQGQGEYTTADGRHYQGTFIDGVLTGEGTATLPDGETYRGEFQDWFYHGEGTRIDAKGNQYSGTFDYGYLHGQGTLVFAKPKNGVEALTGEWAYGEYRDESQAQAPRTSLTEKVLYNQPELLDVAWAKLSDNDPQKIELYFVGVAGYAEQDVFLKEVEYIQQQMTQKYSRENHSLLLVNNTDTSDRFPLVTHVSLRQSLLEVAKRMDAEQDILFLYLTSHGSQDHKFSLTLPGLKIQDLSAEQLGEIIAEVPLKWKVIVVSACFSGGFIEPLKTESTLVMTAAAKTKTSFGCSDDSDMTYFAKAFFKEALPEANSFEEAFHAASEIVSQWEQDEELDASEPQIYIGEAIATQLKNWRRQNWPLEQQANN